MECQECTECQKYNLDLNNVITIDKITIDSARHIANSHMNQIDSIIELNYDLVFKIYSRILNLYDYYGSEIYCIFMKHNINYLIDAFYKMHCGDYLRISKLTAMQSYNLPDYKRIYKDLGLFEDRYYEPFIYAIMELAIKLEINNMLDIISDNIKYKISGINNLINLAEEKKYHYCIARLIILELKFKVQD